MPLSNGPVDWSRIHLIIFDVDGTLYDQRALRFAMLRSLLRCAIETRSIEVIRILRVFRRMREELAESMAADFVNRQYNLVAERCGCDPGRVREIVCEWMEERPLKNLGHYRFPRLEDVFRAATDQRKTIGVFSDYPARAKLEALQLRADVIVTADEPHIGYLKPHPVGLHRMLDLCDVKADRAIMIGDRIERDWAVANKLGVRALIRTRRNVKGIDTFRGYNDPVFRELLCGGSL